MGVGGKSVAESGGSYVPAPDGGPSGPRRQILGLLAGGGRAGTGAWCPRAPGPAVLQGLLGVRQGQALSALPAALSRAVINPAET